jgi:hypothetical protein
MKSSNLIFKYNIHLFVALVLVNAVIFTSCTKEESSEEETPANESLSSSVEGTYNGTLKNSSTNESRSATLQIVKINDSLVSMHCVADGFDSTIINLLYQNFDSTMVCYSGQDFNNHYGHNLNNYNFCNSQPNGWNSGWCNTNNCWSGENNWNAWTNHLNTQHDKHDQHFGGFHMNSLSCNYSFPMNIGNTNYFEIFLGTKNQ